MKRDLVVGACAVSAGVHAALAPAHGVSFVGAAVVLAALAVALTTRPADSTALSLAGAVLAGLIAAYAFVVLREAEPVDALALFTKAVEAVGLLAAAASLRPKGRHV